MTTTTHCCFCDFFPTFQHFIGSIVILFLLHLVKKLVKRIKGKKPVTLHKPDYVQDRVYLYQFPRSPYVAQLSPFCLKVETFLRVHDLDYEVVESFSKKSRHGLVPFIELNGEQVADSQFVIAHLKKHFNIAEPDPAGEIRAFDRLADNSLFYSITWDRCVRQATRTFHPDTISMNVPPFARGLVACLAGHIIGNKAANRIRVSYGNLTDAEIDRAMRTDLAAFSERLGERDFLFGDQITTADCTLFGHLACAYDLPFQQPVKLAIAEDYPNLLAFVNRIKTRAYPNWPRVEPIKKT